MENTDFFINSDRVIQFIGVDAFRELNKPNWFLDLIVFFSIFSAFILFAYFLSSYPFGIVWFLGFLLQGMILQMFGFLGHEWFVHRRIFGEKLGYFFSVIIFTIVLTPFTLYKIVHLKHHGTLNTKDDAEDYKNDLNKRWKRWLMLTLVGQLLAPMRFLADKNQPINYRLDLDPEIQNKTNKKKIFFENIITYGFLTVIIILSFYSNIVLYGYLLPMLFSAPIWSTVRLILEHGTINPKNSLDAVTFYKTNLISGWVFLNDTCDCHLVHHLFPNIPSYNMRKALKLMYPFFLKNGVTERHSLLKLLYFYLIKNYPYRTKWPV